MDQFVSAKSIRDQETIDEAIKIFRENEIKQIGMFPNNKVN